MDNVVTPCDLSALHAHCTHCNHVRCSYRGAETSCPMMSCVQKCGAVFHSCKNLEHMLLCQLEKVSCLNACNGCPAVLSRSDLANHLLICPASIVCCSLEWSRWPVYSRERQQRVPFVMNNLWARSGQLDVALALRDQRVLNEARKYRPRSVIRALRNHSAPGHPTVPLFIGGQPCYETNLESCSQNLPLQSSLSDDSCDDDCDDAPWMSSKKPPGLAKSICLELFQKQSSSGGCSWHPEHDVKCSSCSSQSTAELNVEFMGQKCKRKSASATLFANDDRSPTGDDDVGVQGLDSSYGPETVPSVFNEKTFHSHRSMSDSVQSEINLKCSNVSCEKIGAHCKEAFHRINDAALVNSSVNPPVPVPLALSEVLALDLNLELYSRNSNRPKSIYTFMCGQMFRRDAYSKHVKNVHSDIHSGLSDWLEHRCPLAQYGCTFSVPRLRPKNASITYSLALESFGLKYPVNKILRPSSCIDHSGITIETVAESKTLQREYRKEATPELFASKDFDSAVVIAARESSPMLCNQTSLTSFPLELLLYIARFLDSFSLCNLSMTCWYLRNVCQQLVKKRGIVVQEWKRNKTPEGKITWMSSEQHWMFSTAFDAIHGWEFVDQSAIFRHMEVCRFGEKCELPSSPVALPVRQHPIDILELSIT